MKQAAVASQKESPHGKASLPFVGGKATLFPAPSVSGSNQTQGGGMRVPRSGLTLGLTLAFVTGLAFLLGPPAGAGLGTRADRDGGLSLPGRRGRGRPLREALRDPRPEPARGPDRGRRGPEWRDRGAGREALRRPDPGEGGGPGRHDGRGARPRGRGAHRDRGGRARHRPAGEPPPKLLGELRAPRARGLRPSARDHERRHRPSRRQGQSGVPDA